MPKNEKKKLINNTTITKKLDNNCEIVPTLITEDN